MKKIAIPLVSIIFTFTTIYFTIDYLSYFGIPKSLLIIFFALALTLILAKLIILDKQRSLAKPSD